MRIVRVLGQTSWIWERNEDKKIIRTNLLVACYDVSEFSNSPFSRNIIKSMVISKEDGDAGHQIIVIKIIFQDKVIIPR